MAAVRLTLLMALSVGATASALRANPIRKVVTMLQDMQKTVEDEGKKEEDLFDKFMCYCSGGESALTASISAGEAQIESLTASISRGTAEKSQLDQDVATHKADRAAAENTIKESTAMREKESAEFATTSGDMKSNMNAMDSALEALKKGLSASLLQTGVGALIRNVVKTSPAVKNSEREMLLSYLETGSGTEGGSDQIIGIVEQMKETYAADLTEAEGKEAESKTNFETMMTSKTAEIEAAGKAIETKTARSGSVAVENVQGKADLEKTQTAVEEDTKFKANLATNCATKQKEWDERCKLRAQEIEAISDTIKMMNSDDALELFKTTLPPALIQTAATSRAQIRTAKNMIRNAMKSDKVHAVNRHLMLTALSQGVHGFEKVVGMVDGMVGVLEGEQTQDDKTDVWCIAELDKAEAGMKATEVDIGELGASVDEARDSIASTTSEIDALKAGLAEMDKSVAEATDLRKKEHDVSVEEASSNGAAVQLLGMAKNRLNKFYNPTLYVAPKEEVVEEEFFVQVAVHRAALGQAPEMPSGEYKKSESSDGVINMIDEMIKDVEDDMAVAKRDEEEAQKDYEADMADAATKRSDDSKLVVTKEGEKAEQTTMLEETKESKRTKKQQLEVLEDKIDNLHKTCDFLMAEYAKLKAERTKEEEGLKASKEVLAGSGLGFLQHQ